MRRAWVILGMLACGCPSPPGPPAPSAPQARSPSPVQDGGAEVTAALLEAWLRYQALVEARALPADAGALDLARRERAARAEVGLSVAQVDAVEEALAAVLTKRALAAMAGAEALKELERAASLLTPAQKHQADVALADLKVKATQTTSLAQERRRFGEAAVEAILSREGELSDAWEALLGR